MADFAGEVRRLMGVRGISLRGLAKAASYDPSYLSKVLSGHKPSSPYLAAPRRRSRRGRHDPGRHPAATATPEKQSQRTAAEAIGRGRGAPGRDDR